MMIPVPIEFLRLLFSEDVEEYETDYEGYYCLKLDPLVCSCGHIKQYLEPTRFHVIIVWEEMDDNVLLTTAAYAKELGADPHIVKYEPRFGGAIEFNEAVIMGLL